MVQVKNTLEYLCSLVLAVWSNCGFQDYFTYAKVFALLLICNTGFVRLGQVMTSMFAFIYCCYLLSMSYNYCHNSCKSSLWVRFWFAGMDWTLYMGGYRNGIVDISNLFFLPFDKTKIRFLHFPLFEIFALKQNLCKLQWVSDKARQ